MAEAAEPTDAGAARPSSAAAVRFASSAGTGRTSPNASRPPPRAPEAHGDGRREPPWHVTSRRRSARSSSASRSRSASLAAPTAATSTSAVRSSPASASSSARSAAPRSPSRSGATPTDIAEICGDAAFPATAALLAIDRDQAHELGARGVTVDLGQFTRSEAYPGIYYALFDHASKRQIHTVLHRLVPSLTRAHRRRLTPHGPSLPHPAAVVAADTIDVVPERRPSLLRPATWARRIGVAGAARERRPPAAWNIPS